MPLIASLARTAQFTALAQAIHAAPVPALVGGDRVVAASEPPDRVLTIRGIDASLRRAGATGTLLSELDVPRAVKPHRATVQEEPGDG
ncbi:hypothetical protein ABTX15_32480 [Micromonospora sp. NPDC094482]|uniref:hypothetical protein n=1 Tax=unclassified Micromonospora TaxID=2617518 RepID=UPI0033173A83